jgi:hypothetical protein
MVFYLQLLLWGGMLTIEAIQVFFPLLLWLRPKIIACCSLNFDTFGVKLIIQMCELWHIH